MFWKKPETKQTPFVDFDRSCTIKLANHLSAARCLMRKPNINLWFRQFAELRQVYETSHITKVLNWYCANIRKPFVPLAFSARAFCSKFPNIESAMIRDIGQEIEVSDEAHQITDRLLNLYWPKITPEELAQAVQLSLDNYTSFLTHDTRHFPQAIRNKLAAPSMFTEQWFRDVNQSIAQWDQWSGDIRKQAFTHEHKKFRARGRSWANEYCGDPSRWDQLIESITYKE